MHSEPFNYGIQQSEADVVEDEEGNVNRSRIYIESADIDDEEGKVNISHIPSPAKNIN